MFAIFQAHGAEILCSRCTYEVDDLENLEEISKGDVRWHRFLKSLTDKGYFRVNTFWNFLKILI